MASFFLVCAYFGIGALLLQFVLSLVGIGDMNDVPHDGPDLTHGVGDADAHHAHVGEGLNLWTVRTVTAGLALFGYTGWSLTSTHLPMVVVLLVAVTSGTMAMVGTAYVMRALLRLEADGSLRLNHAVGQPATVYLAIPGQEQGLGKVTLTLQGRTVECPAITRGSSLPTGVPVLVTNRRDDGVLEVIPDAASTDDARIAQS